MFDNNILKDGLVSMNQFPKHQYPFEGEYMSDEVVDKIYEPLPLLIYEKPNNEFDEYE
mgnify:FL=1